MHGYPCRRLKVSRTPRCIRGGRVRGRCVPPLPPSVAPGRGCAWQVAYQIKCHRLGSWQRQSRRQSPMLAPPMQSCLRPLPDDPTLCRGALGWYGWAGDRAPETQWDERSTARVPRTAAVRARAHHDSQGQQMVGGERGGAPHWHAPGPALSLRHEPRVLPTRSGAQKKVPWLTGAPPLPPPPPLFRLRPPTRRTRHKRRTTSDAEGVRPASPTVTWSSSNTLRGCTHASCHAPPTPGSSRASARATQERTSPMASAAPQVRCNRPPRVRRTTSRAGAPRAPAATAAACAASAAAVAASSSADGGGGHRRCWCSGLLCRRGRAP